METINLVIKYKEKYICMMNKNEIDFIHVPHYTEEEAFSNISIFITLLLCGIMDDEFNSTVSLVFFEWKKKFEMSFVPEYLYQIDDNTFVYDMDTLISDTKEYINETNINDVPIPFIEKLPKGLISTSLEEQKNTKNFEKEDEKALYSYIAPLTINKDLLNIKSPLQKEKIENSVLLMYSGGKDSTLAAMRLKNLGYHVYFIHFDNGYMLDTDKPYLTYKYALSDFENFSFPYEFHSISIKNLFSNFFYEWKKEHGENLENGNIDSEIRCLACRSAMYKVTLDIARNYGFSLIAEGARICQKFLIEQPIMIKRFKELASQYGIEVLYPVFDLIDDKEEIGELLKYGLSSKTWESKCLLGREAKEKTNEDEELILNYYESHIKPKIYVKKNS